MKSIKWTLKPCARELFAMCKSQRMPSTLISRHPTSAVTLSVVVFLARSYSRLSQAACSTPLAQTHSLSQFRLSPQYLLLQPQ